MKSLSDVDFRTTHVYILFQIGMTIENSVFVS